MEKLALAFGAILLFVGAVLVIVPLATLGGAIAGWIVGLFFGDTILGVLGQLGLHDVTMWQLGATLGFIGGFLRTKVDAEVKEKKKS